MQATPGKQSIHPSDDGMPPAISPPGDPGAKALPPQPTPDRSGTGGGVGADPAGTSIPPSYIFALGRIEARFPSLSVEKELVQSTGRTETAGLTDRQALQRVLSDRRNRYLARQLCWVLTIEGLETYVLAPRDPLDFEFLVEALRPTPRAADVDLVIGIRGPLAPPQACNGLVVPVVAFDQIYSFDVDELVGSIPRPDRMAEESFRPAAEELFNRIMQLADNAGATDEHRALNYLAVRYHGIYETAVDRYADNYSLTGVEVRPSRLSGVRKIVDVIFSFTSRTTDVTEKYFVRVDVTEEFPFLITKLSPFYER
jgi:PatG C-terminal